MTTSPGLSRQRFDMPRDEVIRRLSAHFPRKDVVFAFSPTQVGDGCEITCFSDEAPELRYAVESRMYERKPTETWSGMTGEEYMGVLLARQREDGTGPGQVRVPSMLEWFIREGDEAYVQLTEAEAAV